jgi:hypothetical protein
MPRVRYRRYCSNFLNLLFLSAGLLEEEHSDDLSELVDEEGEDVDDSQFEFQISEVLELMGATWLQTASALTAEGSRGPYNQWSQDFFITTLQSPDRMFRHQFRYEGPIFTRNNKYLAP